MKQDQKLAKGNRCAICQDTGGCEDITEICRRRPGCSKSDRSGWLRILLRVLVFGAFVYVLTYVWQIVLMVFVVAILCMILKAQMYV